jgi:glycosyltransferase involved in cell wall biosynthesis
MKVLLTLSDSGSVRAGMEVYSDYLRKAFPDLEVIDFSASKEEAFAQSFSPLKQPMEARAVAKHFLKSMPELKPEVIFTNGMFGWALKRGKAKAPVVNISHGCYSSFADAAMKKNNPDYYRIRFIYSFFERMSAANADVRVSNSEFTERMVKSRYNLESTVIRNAVDTALFRPADKQEARERLGLPLNRKVVLFVGRDDYSKGYDIVRKVALMNPGIIFLSVLFPGGHSRERNLISLPSVEHRKLPDYYCAADACLFPSRYEGFGYVALESLACGTPVVSSDTGIMHSIRVKGLSVVGSFRPEDYSDALNAVLEEEKPAGRSYVVREFSLDRFCSEYRKLAAELQP